MNPRRIPTLTSGVVLLSIWGMASSSDSEISVSKEVLIAAHRGGYESDKRDGAPENSIANITVCESKGYQIYETDIQRTKDGEFVIVHDATIDRETTGKGKASEMDLAVLKRLFKRFRDGSVSGERVATLEEFLREGKGRTIYKADLKPGVSEHFREIVRIVEEHDARDGILFRVPYGEADRFAGFEAEGVACAQLLMFKVSSLRQIDDIQSRFDPPTIQVNVAKSDPANAKTLGLIRHATEKGMLVETHAEGGPDEWEKLIRAGVRMFHTGKPSKMKAFLEERRTNRIPAQ